MVAPLIIANCRLQAIDFSMRSWQSKVFVYLSNYSVNLHFSSLRTFWKMQRRYYIQGYPYLHDLVNWVTPSEIGRHGNGSNAAVIPVFNGTWNHIASTSISQTAMKDIPFHVRAFFMWCFKLNLFVHVWLQWGHLNEVLPFVLGDWAVGGTLPVA